MKTLTRKQLEARKAQAVRFVRDVLDDDDKADDIEDETSKTMPSTGTSELQTRKE